MVNKMARKLLMDNRIDELAVKISHEKMPVVKIRHLLADLFEEILYERLEHQDPILTFGDYLFGETQARKEIDYYRYMVNGIGRMLTLCNCEECKKIYDEFFVAIAT